MNPFAKFKGNPGHGNTEEHGDLWVAIDKCSTRLAVLDERTRVALMLIIPMLGFLVAVQLVCLGVLVR